MINLDKIIKNIPAEVLETINQLAKENKRTDLENWLKGCKEEIIFRHENKIDMYHLYYEKYYLEYILN